MARAVSLVVLCLSAACAASSASAAPSGACEAILGQIWRLNGDVQKVMTDEGLIPPLPPEAQISEAEAARSFNMARGVLRAVPFGKRMESVAINKRMADDLTMMNALAPKMSSAGRAKIDPGLSKLNELIPAYRGQGC